MEVLHHSSGASGKPVQDRSVTEQILQVEELHVSFNTPYGVVQAVNGVNLHLDRGEILVVIGESGSGKSVTAMTIMGAVHGKNVDVNGRVLYQGQDLLSLPREVVRRLRGNKIAMIPQDPMVSFDPVYPIGDQIGEAIRAHMPVSRKEARCRAVTLLERVGIPKAELRASHFPHQFSGGMAQRALIAMALACEPEVLIADEPTTALDVTVQAQILELLRSLQDSMGLAVLLITHDMGVAASIADRVAVMYAGRIVEQARSERLFYESQHPYTWGLLRSTTLSALNADGELQTIEGRPPSLVDLPSGCPFHPRCPYVMDICRHNNPSLISVLPEHLAACHLSANERSKYRPQ